MYFSFLTNYKKCLQKKANEILAASNEVKWAEIGGNIRYFALTIVILF